MKFKNKFLIGLIFLSIFSIGACGTIQPNPLLSKDNGVNVVFKDLKTEVSVTEDQINSEIIPLSVDIINSGDFNVGDGVIYFTDSHVGTGGIDGELLHSFYINSAYLDANGRLQPSIINDERIGEFSYDFRNLLVGQETELNFNARAIYEVVLNDIFVDEVCIQGSESKECKNQEIYSLSKIKNNRAPLMVDKIEKSINFGDEDIADVEFNIHFTKLDKKGYIADDIGGKSLEPDGGLVNFVAEIEDEELTCSGLNYFGNQFKWDNSKTEGTLRCNAEIPVDSYSYSTLNMDMSYFYGSIKSSSVKFIRKV